MKTCVLLEGGSYRGIYTSGVLDTFMEHDLYPDCIVGVSAGSLNGIGYVAKQPGRCRDVVLTYGLDDRYIGKGAIRDEHALVGFDFILKELQHVLPFDEAEFRSPDRKFYAEATNCHTGELEFFDRDDFTTEKFMDAISASCSMPFLCRRVRIGDEEYLDGGIASRLGLEFLDLHPEYDRAVLVMTRPLDYRKGAMSKLTEKLAQRLYLNYPLVVDNLRHQKDIYEAECQNLQRFVREGRLLVISPEYELGIGHLERDIDRLKLGYETGTRDAELRLDEVTRWMKGE